MSRIGIEEATNSVASEPSHSASLRATSGSDSSSPSSASTAMPTRASASRHRFSQPCSTSSPSGCGSALDRRIPTTLSGSCHSAYGSNAICVASSPPSHARRGFEVGRSPTRNTNSGPVRGRELRVAQQQVVVGDRGLVSPRARRRVGEHGNPRAGRERGDGRGVGGAGACDDQQPPGRVRPGTLGQLRKMAVARGSRMAPRRRGRWRPRQRPVEHERLAEREVEVDRTWPAAEPRPRRRGRRAS